MYHIFIQPLSLLLTVKLLCSEHVQSVGWNRTLWHQASTGLKTMTRNGNSLTPTNSLYGNCWHICGTSTNIDSTVPSVQTCLISHISTQTIHKYTGSVGVTGAAEHHLQLCWRCSDADAVLTGSSWIPQRPRSCLLTPDDVVISCRSYHFELALTKSFHLLLCVTSASTLTDEVIRHEDRLCLLRCSAAAT